MPLPWHTSTPRLPPRNAPATTAMPSSSRVTETMVIDPLRWRSWTTASATSSGTYATVLYPLARIASARVELQSIVCTASPPPSSLSVPGGCRRFVPGHPSEDGAGHEAGAPRIVLVEEPGGELPARVEPPDLLAGGVHDLRAGRDLEAAERERDAARHRKAEVRRGVQPLGPVRLRRRDAGRGLAVLDRGIEGPGVDGRVELGHRAPERVRLDPGLLRELRPARRVDARRPGERVRLLQQGRHLLVEDLKRGPQRLPHDLLAVPP